jgi:uncharacterized membrane protein (Fun14 family)
MAANPSIAIPNLIPDARAVSESSEPKTESLLERIVGLFSISTTFLIPFVTPFRFYQ